MIITISGKQGAGKTTVAKILSAKLNFDFISIGDLQGEIAMEKKMTIGKLMALGKNEKWVHQEMDKKTKEIGKEKDNFVIEGWLAYHFIPHSFKIFLEVNEDVGAKRIFGDSRLDEPKQKTIEKTKENLKKRLKDAQEGFKKVHGINFLDKSKYNFILNTSNITSEKAAEIILEKIKFHTSP